MLGLLVCLLNLLNTFAANLPWIPQPWGSGGAPSARGIPDFGYNPTHVAVQSGLWHQSSTWNAGIPNANSVVLVPAQFEVVIGDRTATGSFVANAKYVAVRGKLTFSFNQNVTLNVHTVLIYGSGHVTIGEVNNPVVPSVTNEIIFVDDTTRSASTGDEDPEQWGLGLIVLGQLEMCGWPRLPIAAPFAYEHTQVPSSTITLNAILGDCLDLSSPVWRPNDEILIPDNRLTQPDGDRDRYELLRMDWCQQSSIVPYHWNVSLKTPLQFERLAHHIPDDSTVPPHKNVEGSAETALYMTHAINVERNVIIRSAGNVISNRGYVLIASNANVDIRFAKFEGLGRSDNYAPIDNSGFTGPQQEQATYIGSNQDFRHAVTFFHYYGEMPNSAKESGIFLGNVIADSKKFGLSLFDTHHLLVMRNVIYRVSGSGIILRSGNEGFNRIEENYIVRVDGKAATAFGAHNSVYGDGSCGTGIWLRGTQSYILRNYVIGVHTNYTDGYGYTFFVSDSNVNWSMPAKAGDAFSNWLSVHPYRQPILEFNWNSFLGNGWGCLQLWGIGIGWVNAVPAQPPLGINFPPSDVGSLIITAILTASTVNDNFFATLIHSQFIQNFFCQNPFGTGIYASHTFHLTIASFLARFDPLRVFAPGATLTKTKAFTCEDNRCFALRFKNAHIAGSYIGIEAPHFINYNSLNPVYAGTHNMGAFSIQDGEITTAVGVLIQQPYSQYGSAQLGDASYFFQFLKFNSVGADVDTGRASHYALQYRPVNQSCGNDYLYNFTAVVFSHQNMSGVNFQMFFESQSSSFIVPFNGTLSPCGLPIKGSPTAATNNSDLFALTGSAIGGQVAPCEDSSTYTKITGGKHAAAGGGYVAQKATVCPIGPATKLYVCNEMTCPQQGILYECFVPYNVPVCGSASGTGVSTSAPEDIRILQLAGSWVYLLWEPVRNDEVVGYIDGYQLYVTFDPLSGPTAPFPFIDAGRSHLIQRGLFNESIVWFQHQTLQVCCPGYFSPVSNFIPVEWTSTECGNGILEIGEQCDSGLNCDTTTCTCQSPSYPSIPLSIDCWVSPTLSPSEPPVPPTASQSGSSTVTTTNSTTSPAATTTETVSAGEVPAGLLAGAIGAFCVCLVVILIFLLFYRRQKKSSKATTARKNLRASSSYSQNSSASRRSRIHSGKQGRPDSAIQRPPAFAVRSRRSIPGTNDYSAIPNVSESGDSSHYSPLRVDSETNLRRAQYQARVLQEMDYGSVALSVGSDSNIVRSEYKDFREFETQQPQAQYMAIPNMSTGSENPYHRFSTNGWRQE